VDHQIEHDTDLVAPAGKRTETMGLDEPGFAKVVAESQNGGVKALDMADLKDPAFLFRKSNKCIRLIEAARDWFFYEKMSPGFEDPAAQFSMDLGRSYHAERFYAIEEFLVIGKSPRAGLLGDLAGSRLVDIDDSDKIHILHFRQDAGVVPAEVTYTDNGDGCSFVQSFILLSLSRGGHTAPGGSPLRLKPA
jgi:hypothetical protein